MEDRRWFTSNNELPKSKSSESINNILESPTVINVNQEVVLVKETVKEIKKKRSKRCNICRKKVKMHSFTCKCGNNVLFCARHRYPDEHSCAYDWKSESRDQLKKNNPKIVFSKLQKI